MYYQHLLVPFEELLSLRLSDHFALVVGCINNIWLHSLHLVDVGEKVQRLQPFISTSIISRHASSMCMWYLLRLSHEWSTGVLPGTCLKYFRAIPNLNLLHNSSSESLENSLCNATTSLVRSRKKRINYQIADCKKKHHWYSQMLHFCRRGL